MPTTLPALAGLNDLQQEILPMLLAYGLPASTIAGQLTARNRSAHQVAAQLRHLRKRHLVAYVPSNACAYWCLTPSGRAVAEAIKLQKELRAAISQLAFATPQPNHHTRS